MDYNFHWQPVIGRLPDLLLASLDTLQVAALSIVLGIVIGLLLAILRMNARGRWTPLQWFAVAWIEIARNTPVLFQLFFFGFGLGAWGWHLSPFMIVLAGLSFNCAGYLAENFRGGFQSIPDTQYRAARSVGMSAGQTYYHIIIPQVLRKVWHPLTNQIVWAVLMSSLGMLVGYQELTGSAQYFASRTYRIFEYFAVVALIYYALVKLILMASRMLGWRLFRSEGGV
ncbi:amino acid ABC transporter permease [Saccharospirillum salsuginis]|uniref:ABC transporter permease n=1 Tax=Saccharospirillum salsuginis TaxID=418750 RepID=A0A918NHW8_9GAMM|nr:amino acid ABC transporter permease [Saccharospirillum salsuginis]GGX68737.1 ABC transporter permease [Saccharospirillum salsuginis]